MVSVHKAFALAVLFLVNASLHAETSVDVSGVRFETSAHVGKQNLQLNGAGTRYWFLAKVYAAALYSSRPLRSSTAAVEDTGAKRVQIVMLRDVSGEEYARNFSKALRASAKREELGASIPGLVKLGEVFAAQSVLRPHDTVTLDYVPGEGTSIRINGKLRAEPIPAPEFYRSVLRTLIGDNPVDSRLRDALLNRPGTSSQS